MKWAGGVAGFVSWAVLHPIDVMKTLRQTQAIGDTRSSFQLASIGYGKEGMPFFFRGYGATLLRSFPVSAVTFLVYEWTMEGLNAVV